MGLRDLLDKGKCLVGLHAGEWVAPSPTHCRFTRRCVRCSAEHVKVEHQWSAWDFIAADSCDQRRTCPRCSEAEVRVTHAFAAPAWVRDAACEQQSNCTRCAATQDAPTRHLMDQWRDTTDDGCTQVEQCSRCAGDGTRTRIEHRWAEWQHSNAHDGAVRVCRRCGELQVKPRVAPVADFTVPEVTDAATADMLARAAATAPQAPAAAAAIDARLVGRWRHTESMGGSSFSFTTDTHIALDHEGRLARWTHSVSSLGEQTSPPRYGLWSASSNVIRYRYDDGEEGQLQYEVHQRELVFPDGGVQKYWERTA